MTPLAVIASEASATRTGGRSPDVWRSKHSVMTDCFGPASTSMRVLAMTALFLLSILAAPAHAEILTVFSDQGVPGMPPGYNPVITFSGGPAVFQGTSTAVVPPEGY